MAITGLAVVLLIAALTVVIRAVARARYGVSRQRVETFARRQGLQVTVSNGPLIIDYLAVTRRWRTAGVLIAVLVAVVWSAAGHQLSLEFVNVLAAWFLGAVAAEWAIAGPRPTGPRAASLVPRRLTDYVRRVPARVPYVAATLSVAIAGAAAVASPVAPPLVSAPRWQIGGIAVAAVLSVAAVWAVQRRVLHRPQPLDAADVVAADDAIRSRSLHVLLGAAIALSIYCVAWQCNILGPLVDVGSLRQLLSAGGVGMLLGPVWGFVTATTPFHVRRASSVAGESPW